MDNGKALPINDLQRHRVYEGRIVQGTYPGSEIPTFDGVGPDYQEGYDIALNDNQWMVSFSQNVWHGTTNLPQQKVLKTPDTDKITLDLPEDDRRCSVVFYLHNHMEASNHGKDIIEIYPREDCTSVKRTEPVIYNQPVNVYIKKQ